MTMFANVGRAGVRAIDLALQRHYRLFLFSDNPACVLRVAPTVNAHVVTLRDGTLVARDEPILEVHLWNERLPILPRDGATLAWGVDFALRLQYSLRLLADYLAREPRFIHIRALHAELGFLEVDQFPEMHTLVERLGFEFVVGDAPGWRVWRYTFWQNVFSWWLMWTFNPVSLEGKHFAKMGRGELWLSRATLIHRYRGG
jgi:hypothetical protein